MEPLDPELRRLVHDGMVQAVPSQEVEDRLLLGLLARLPQGGPPGGAESSAPAGEGTRPRHGGGEGAASTASTGTAAAAAASKPWLWVVLGVATVAGAVVVGGERGPERAPAEAQHDAREPGASAKTEPVSARAPEPSASSRAPSVERTSASSDPSVTGVAPDRSSTTTRPPRRPASKAATGRSTDATPTPTEAASASDDLAAEIHQIAAADRALAGGDLRGALRLAREHAVAHPHGQLALERRAIELGARCQLGEAGAAEAAAAFLRDHADAPAAAKVRTRCAAEK
jgi:hypothetical protein